MKDPKIVNLVEQFYERVAALNVVWHELNEEGVYISTKVEGEHAVGSKKTLVVDRIEQTVNYKRTPNERMV